MRLVGAQRGELAGRRARSRAAARSRPRAGAPRGPAAAGVSGAGAARRGRPAVRRGSGSGSGSPRSQAREPGQQVAARAVAGRVGVEHDAAAERVGGRERADHEPVAARRDERLLQAQLEVAAAELGQPRRASRACRGGRRRASRRRGGCRASPSRARRRRGTWPRAAPAPRPADDARRRARDLVPARDPGAGSARRAGRPPRARAARRGPGRERTRAAVPAGRISTSSPRAAVPDHSVPVTTVPAPRIVNERSTCRRSGPSRTRGPRHARRRPLQRGAQLLDALAGARRHRRRPPRPAAARPPRSPPARGRRGRPW